MPDASGLGASRAAALVAAHPFHRHRWYDRVLRGPFVDGALDASAGEAFDAAPTQVVVERSGQPVGATSLRSLPFECEVLGVPVHRCAELVAVGDRRQAVAALAAAVLDRARGLGGGLVVARIDGEDLDALAGAQRGGFAVIDAGAVWLARGRRRTAVDPPAGTSVEVLDREGLAALAATATEGIVADAVQRFRASHFHAEERLDPRRCDELYRRWASASIDGTWSDGAVVVRAGAVVVGMASFRTRRAGGDDEAAPTRINGDWFSLASLDAPAGTGGAMVRAGLGTDADLIEYVVQARSPYAGLFARTGAFDVVSPFLTLHAWVEP